MRPDGREVKWRTARQTTFDLPFLCGDLTPREWRVPAGAARLHPNGARGIQRITVAVQDARVSAERYAALLGVAPSTDFIVGGTTVDLREQPLPPRGEGVVELVMAR